MISILRAVRANTGEQSQRAIECYAGLLKAIEANIVPVSEQLASGLRQKLEALRAGVNENSQPQSLAASLPAAETALREFRVKCQELLQKKEKDIREVLSLMAKATVIAGTNASACENGLLGFVQQIECATQLSDLSEIREKLAGQVVAMRQHAETVRRESNESLEQLQAELRTFRTRLAETELLATKDPLTGVCNRREADRLMEEKVAAQEPFCIALFDLDNFKAVNDRWGHQWGDQVLKTFARRLSEQAKPGEVVCRWGGDEFVVILESAANDAMERSKRLAAAASGRYHVAVGGKNVRIDVNASLAIAAYQAGDTFEQLFARADDLLYRRKGRRTAEVSACQA